MFAIILLLATFIGDVFRSRRRLEVENLLLRHQLINLFALLVLGHGQRQLHMVCGKPESDGRVAGRESAWMEFSETTDVAIEEHAAESGRVATFLVVSVVLDLHRLLAQSFANLEEMP